MGPTCKLIVKQKVKQMVYLRVGWINFKPHGHLDFLRQLTNFVVAF